MDNDVLFFPGGAVKALDDTTRRIGGLLVPFGSPKDLDLQGEYFSKATDLGPLHPLRIRFHHGVTPALGILPFGEVTPTLKDEGIWVEGPIAIKAEDCERWAKGVLAEREAYEAKVYEMVKAGKLGWSSSAPPNLVRKAASKAGGVEITSWPLGDDATLSPKPVHPWATALPLKALLDAGLPGLDGFLKGEYLGADADAQIAFAAIDRALDLARMKVRYAIGAGSDYYGPMPPPAAPRTRAERIAAVKGSLEEMTAAALRAAGMLPEDDGKGEGKAQKAMTVKTTELITRLRGPSDG